MEFLIATAALTFREEGARFVRLSGAPLARLDRGEQSRALQRLLDMIANTMEPVYGFQSQLHLKAKFQPLDQPLCQTYPARPDRHRDRPRLATPPHVAAGPAPAHQAPPTVHQPRPSAAARKETHPTRADTVVTGRVTRPRNGG
jgi:hypothetical protein